VSNEVYVISDLHLGHRNIAGLRPNADAYKDSYGHDEWLIETINTVVKKKDTLWILGDIAFNNVGLLQVGRINGYKKMILGNHDKMPVTNYMPYGRVMMGLVRYKGFWLSHAPIHPQELYGCRNVHGHVHAKTIPDERYHNVCVEALDGIPILIDSLDKGEMRDE